MDIVYSYARTPTPDVCISVSSVPADDCSHRESVHQEVPRPCHAGIQTPPSVFTELSPNIYTYANADKPNNNVMT